MKRTLTLLGLSLMLSAVMAFAQRPMDDDDERRVRIVRGPDIVNVTDDSATINWVTNHSGANHVRYRIAGSNDEWQSAYHQGGGTNHSLQLTGLRPGRTYDWQILTRDGDLRTSGQFQTARRDRDDYDRDRRDHDGDHDRDYDFRDYRDRITLYRASNRQGSVHLYTTNVGEQNRSGFHAEGNAGFILASQRRGTMPLYRMRGPNGDVFLAVGQDEVEKMRSYNYRDDGTLG